MKTLFEQEKEWIHFCLLVIQQKLGWDHYQNWKQRDFEKLSNLILDETKTCISVTTLKRLTGKAKSKGSPSRGTLDTLAFFLGYDNWPSFKIENQNKFENFKYSQSTPGKPQVVLKYLSSIKTKLFLAFFIIILAAFWVYRQYSLDLYKDVNLRCDKNSGEAPFPATLKYDISGVNTDEIFLLKAETNKVYRLPKDSRQKTITYYNPGFKEPIIKLKERHIDTVRLFVYTNEWMVQLDQEHNLYYVKADTLLKQNGNLTVPEKKVKKHLDPYSDYIINFFNMKQFGFGADDLIFKTRIKTLPNDLCHRISINIIGVEGWISIPLSMQACKGYIALVVNNQTIEGGHQDLTTFTRDMRQWHDVEIHVKDMMVTFYIDGEKVYKLSYQEKLEEFIGFRYKIYNTTALIDYVKLFNSNNDTLLYYDFNQNRIP